MLRMVWSGAMVDIEKTDFRLVIQKMIENWNSRRRKIVRPEIHLEDKINRLDAQDKKGLWRVTQVPQNLG